MQNFLIKHLAEVPYAPSLSPLVPNLNFILTHSLIFKPKKLLHLKETVLLLKDWCVLPT